MAELSCSSAVIWLTRELEKVADHFTSIGQEGKLVGVWPALQEVRDSIGLPTQVRRCADIHQQFTQSPTPSPDQRDQAPSDNSRTDSDT